MLNTDTLAVRILGSYWLRGFAGLTHHTEPCLVRVAWVRWAYSPYGALVRTGCVGSLGVLTIRSLGLYGLRVFAGFSDSDRVLRLDSEQVILILD
jgi:hypothetical protein